MKSIAPIVIAFVLVALGGEPVRCVELSFALFGLFEAEARLRNGETHLATLVLVGALATVGDGLAHLELHRAVELVAYLR